MKIRLEEKHLINSLRSLKNNKRRRRRRKRERKGRKKLLSNPVKVCFKNPYQQL